MTSLIKTLRGGYSELRLLHIKGFSFGDITRRKLSIPYSVVPKRRERRMSPAILPQLFKHVDENVPAYKALLREAVAIPSVSCDPKARNDCVRMVKWMQEKLREVGATSELHDIGFQVLEGQQIKLPPVLTATLGNDTRKNTICIYGHLDVQPALKSDGWDSDPFTLEERNGKLYGRGATDDKGPVLGWIHAINAYKAVGSEKWHKNSAYTTGRGKKRNSGERKRRSRRRSTSSSSSSSSYSSSSYSSLSSSSSSTRDHKRSKRRRKEMQILPVNLKFVFECMEESGSEGLDKLLLEKLKPNGFFNTVDYVCISDNYWLGTTKPCITYGLRGISYYFLEIECAKMDLHSGVYGGTVNEAMSDLIYMMNTLVDKNGKMLIDGIYNSVAPLDEKEKKLYANIDFDTEKYRSSIGAPALAHNGDKEKILMHRWRYPVLSLHGIEGAHFQKGAKTVIPGKVVGKFSIRIVPNQEPAEVEKLVFNYIHKKWNERGSVNKMKITAQSGRAWTENPNHPHYQAAARATKLIYQTEPDMTREGGSIPVTITLAEASGCNVLLLPMGAGDDMAHSQNEKINVRNYIEGIKLFAAYFHEVSKLPKNH